MFLNTLILLIYAVFIYRYHSCGHDMKSQLALGSPNIKEFKVSNQSALTIKLVKCP